VPIRVAVVGHIEWVEFARVDRVPAAGEIVHSEGSWQDVGGGGGVAAVQLAKLAGGCGLFTRLGDDALAGQVRDRLESLGVRVHAEHAGRTRRAVTLLDRGGERTITTLGERLAPSGSDPLPWGELHGADAAYFTAGDRAAVEAARSARILVATSRVVPALADARVQLDALVGSGSDPSEAYGAGTIVPEPRLVVMTAGMSGGEYRSSDGRSGRWEAERLAGPIADAYGAGDSFAAGLAFALGEGRDTDAALRFAARCGAACLMGHGPFEGQLALAG
jgi:ribokinase